MYLSQSVYTIMKNNNLAYIINAGLVLFSLVAGLVLSELLLRLILNPVDYLEPDIIGDSTYGHTIKPYSAGHDGWGFRNESIPDKADIVAIGDSQTYGNGATASKSWPSILENKTKLVVYNMGLGEYGPVQYYHLLIDKALTLQPKVVIVGLYFGNDFYDASIFNKYNRSGYITAAHDSNITLLSTIQNLDKNCPDTSYIAKIQSFLRRYSMVYRVLNSLDIVSPYTWLLTIKESKKNKNVILFKQDSIKTAFLDGFRYAVMNPDNLEIKNGIEHTLYILKEMQKFCEQHGITFIVLLLPTKENVFSTYFNHTNTIFTKLLNTVEIESKIKSEFIQFFDDNNIHFIDPLENLRNNVRIFLLYQTGLDGHPRSKGYEIIADTIIDYLRNNHLIH